MPSDPSAALLREGLMLLLTAGGPLFAVLLIVGLVVGVIQSATQINDSATSFLPRLVAAAIACWALGGWMVEQFARFFARSVELIATRPF